MLAKYPPLFHGTLEFPPYFVLRSTDAARQESRYDITQNTHFWTGWSSSRVIAVVTLDLGFTRSICRSAKGLSRPLPAKVVRRLSETLKSGLTTLRTGEFRTPSPSIHGSSSVTETYLHDIRLNLQ